MATPTTPTPGQRAGADRFIETLLGAPRGQITAIRSSGDRSQDQRGAVRSWLKYHGVPAATRNRASLADMLACLNDTSNATVIAMAAGTMPDQGEPLPMPAPIPPEAGERQAPTPNQQPHNTQDTQDKEASPMTTPNAAPSVAAIVGAVTAALAAMPQQGIDADAVREIVRAEIDAQAHIPRSLVVQIGDVKRDLPPARRHAVFDTALLVVANKVPLALIGPAGSGKTHLAEQIAQALDLSFYLSGALTGTHELLGYMDAAGSYHTTPFRQAYEHGGVFLLDEVDGSDPAVPLALNAAIANGRQAFPDGAEPVSRHPDFRVIAGANTYWSGADRVYVGRNQLDGATIDRFFMLEQDYDVALERDLSPVPAWVGFVQEVRSIIASQKIRAIVSMRASLQGGVLVAAGLPWRAVAEGTIWRGMDAPTKERVLSSVDRATLVRLDAYRPAPAPKAEPLPLAAE